jgi:hypothetical protein
MGTAAVKGAAPVGGAVVGSCGPRGRVADCGHGPFLGRGGDQPTGALSHPRWEGSPIPPPARTGIGSVISGTYRTGRVPLCGGSRRPVWGSQTPGDRNRRAVGASPSPNALAWLSWPWGERSGGNPLAPHGHLAGWSAPPMGATVAPTFPGVGAVCRSRL